MEIKGSLSETTLKGGTLTMGKRAKSTAGSQVNSEPKEAAQMEPVKGSKRKRKWKDPAERLEICKRTIAETVGGVLATTLNWDFRTQCLSMLGAENSNDAKTRVTQLLDGIEVDPHLRDKRRKREAESQAGRK